MPCSIIPKALLRNKLVRSSKLQEHNMCIIPPETKSALSNLQEPANSRTVKDVHKSFQNKTLVTYTHTKNTQSNVHAAYNQ